MKKLFLLFTLAFVAMSCETGDEKLDDFIGRDDSSVTTIANNQIWYTSTDGEIVEPYGNWKNNYADALITFGVNIVSNTYVDGKGVIEFDGDVTIIGDAAFGGCNSLRSVTIPDSVTTIGNYAFEYCSSLTSVTIPDSVTTIGMCTFSGCSSLQEFNGKFASEDGRCLIIDGTLNSFAPAGLTEYTIPDSVTTIGYGAFYQCSSLTSVTIPDSVTTIGSHAFYSCSSLISVTIPDRVTTIGYSAFYQCSSLTSVTIPDSVTTIGNMAFRNCDNLTSVTIGDRVTTIGEYAFAGCSSLTSVTIGDSVTTIGNYAFEYCSSLTSVTIPDSVTSIGDSAFLCCCSLQEFNGKFASEDGRCLIIDGTLNSFAPAGLTEYTIPDSVTTIGEAAFQDCDSLTSVTIPDSVTTIGYSAFYQCSSLTSVTIPDSVTAIGYAAFAYCDSLTSVYCKAITPPALSRTYVFDNNGSGRKIYVPMESVEAYRSAEGWSEYADDIVGYNF